MTEPRSPDLADLVRALEQVGSLKRLPRAGWRRAGLERAESVADHTFQATVLGLILGPALGVDGDRLLRLLLVHDLAESDPDVGDITPHCGIDRAEKQRRERAAIEHLAARLPNGADLLALWAEYDAGMTPEARLAHEIDALEMGLQTRDYERRHGIDLSEFRQSAAARVRHPLLRQLLDPTTPGPSDEG